MELDLTMEQVKQLCYFHHEATRPGYLSRKIEYLVKPYEGRFGVGYTVLKPMYKTTRYCKCEYWIFKE